MNDKRNTMKEEQKPKRAIASVPIAVSMRGSNRYLRVGLTVRSGRPVIDLRIFVKWDSRWRASSTGLTVEPSEIGALIEALRKAHSELKRFGVDREPR